MNLKKGEKMTGIRYKKYTKYAHIFLKQTSFLLYFQKNRISLLSQFKYFLLKLTTSNFKKQHEFALLEN